MTNAPLVAVAASALFDYGPLDPVVAANLRETANAIRASARPQADEIVATGSALRGVKEKLRHGQFGDWLFHEFGWSIRTAQRYMRVSEAFEVNTTAVSHLPIASIHRLAALPAEMRDRVVGAGVKTEGEISVLVGRIIQDANRAKAQAKKSPEQKALEQSGGERRSRRQQREREALERNVIKQRKEIRELICALDPSTIDIFKRLGSLPDHLVREELRQREAARDGAAAQIETREQWLSYMIRGWNRACAEWREHFLDHVAAVTGETEL